MVAAFIVTLALVVVAATPPVATSLLVPVLTLVAPTHGGVVGSRTTLRTDLPPPLRSCTEL